MQVTNNAKGPRTFQVKGEGKDAPPVTVTLEPGESQDLDLVTPDHAILKAWKESGEVSFGAKAKEKASGSEDTGLKAAHRGGGRFSVMAGDEEVLEGLNKADADAFNGLSDEDKAAFVASKKA